MKKQGRPLLLGQEMDMKVQLYLKKVRDGGEAVSARVTILALSRGIWLNCDRTMLAEFRGHVELSIHWAHSLLKSI